VELRQKAPDFSHKTERETMPGVLNQISGTSRSIQSANVDTQLELGKVERLGC